MTKKNLSSRPGARKRAAWESTGSATHILVAGVVMALHAVPAAAQSNAPSTLPAISVTGEREQGYAATRSTTATKTDTPLRDTPQSITVVTQDQMRDQAVQSIAEALRYVPGVGFAQGEGNRETPIFRGITTTGDFFIDGIRDDVQYYRDLYNIESVEVFRGPNAMIFGRGATGGLINRVSKTPEWTPFYAGSVTVGSHSNKRATVDLNQPLSEQWSLRVNGMYEDSDSYRDGVWIRRKGINPTLSWRPDARTLVTMGYEHFEDDRIADRGISSYQGRPVDTSRSTFFGNAAGSPSWSRLDALNLLIEHEFDSGLTLRNRSRFSDQDKFYQNVFPGAVNATGDQVAISAYNNATSRKSLFNQTDLSLTVATGAIKHKLLAGVELGQQDTDNFRNTGFFNNTATSVNVPLSNPTTQIPVTYRQSATDADNTGRSTVAALYFQDQIELSRQFQVIAGLRYDKFKTDFTNKRTGEEFNTTDNLVSPRIGVVYKPLEAVSLYANYSMAFLPRAGDQLASLNATNAAFSPEKFKNYEIGAKWDVMSRLAATAAIYQLDRTNVVVVDPADVTRTTLSDGQRVRGLELGIGGNITSAWSVAGGYSYTDAKFKGRTTTGLAPDGSVGQVPKHTFALWNRYDFSPVWGAGVGVIHRTKMLASNEIVPTATTQNVDLPGYTRLDGALFFKVSKEMRVQVNVENLFDKKYYINSNSNTNITPGSPRALRVTLNARF